MTTFKVVIPARLASTRLPEKPLADVAGKPLVTRVWERAYDAGADEVIVAADDTRIVDVVTASGGRAVLTSPNHPSGTDRLAEVAASHGWRDDVIVVNLQGDEPLVPGALLRRLANALAEEPEAALATAATPITEPRELFSPSAVKVVVDDRGLALTFSRAPIPWARDAFGPLLRAEPPNELPKGVPYLRHLGLYAYRVSTLKLLASTPPAAIEKAESLEQLRALAIGLRIHVTVLDQAPPPGVDTPEDLERVRALFAPR
ncbi:MAG: 3-deoxy-manno-octulosonate cytidylyltransferase [Sandaracinus sp.]|nr:3-deoxy-manno-octulosonate cytidylyltransferase [Sandaracinus sp.]